VIAVPEAQVTKLRVAPKSDPDLGPSARLPPLIRVEKLGRPPERRLRDRFLSGHWFSIDDRDMASKHVLSPLMFLSTFVQTGAKDAARILTIPTTR